MLSYNAALDFVYSLIDYGIKRMDRYAVQTFDLERMRRLAAVRGWPQDRYPTVHIAGTKGKGSVTAMCAAALRAAGYRTGMYISPHLDDFRERIQVNGEMIPEAAVAALVSDLKPLAEAEPGITTFELITLMAFEYFARVAVDVAVIEVGLGGRLDATNIIVPRVAVITSISHDHTALLGSTLAEIAFEKGGIIKPGVPVVSAAQSPEVLTVLERLAAERGAPLTVIGREWKYRRLSGPPRLDGQSFVVWSAGDGQPGDEARQAQRLEIPLLGGYQVENAVVAYAALRQLNAGGLAVTEKAISAGFSVVEWPVRFEVVNRAPIIVADGAHNPDSARKLVATLDEYFPGRRLTLIFGAAVDKDVTGILAELLPRAVRLILTRADHPRAAAPADLAPLVAGDVPVEVYVPVARALERAREMSTAGEVIVVCGSLFVAAEARRACRNAAVLVPSAASPDRQ